MTREELNKVREMNRDLKDAERSLELLRLSIAAKVPVRDGMPKAMSTDSRVEIVTIRIIDLEKEIDEIKAEMIGAMKDLEVKIKKAIVDRTARKLFILRYVDCMYFRDIAFALGYSEAHIYYLHDKFIEKLIVDDSQ